MEKKETYFVLFFKVLLAFYIPLAIFFIILTWVNKTLYHLWPLILVSVVNSFVLAKFYGKQVSTIYIADIEKLKENIIELLEKNRWKIASQNENKIIIKPRIGRFYAWLYKEKIEIEILEDQLQLTGIQTYIDRLKPVLLGKKSIMDNKIMHYLIRPLLIVLLLVIFMVNFGLIDKMPFKIYYHNRKISGLEKIYFQENNLLGNTENNINNYGGIVEKGGKIFYIKDHSNIYKTDKNFSFETRIVKRSSPHGLQYLNLLDDWLIYREGKAIKRVKTDGSQMDTIFDLAYTLDIHLLDNYLYFILVEDGFKLYRMDINGEGLEKILDKEVADIAIYDNKLYYSYKEKDMGYLKTLDLQEDKDVLMANLYTNDMILDKNIIYYIDGDNRKLYQYDLLNKEKKQITEDEISKFLKDEKAIYYMGKGENGFHPGRGLYKIDLDDGSQVKLNDDVFMETILLIDDWILYKSANTIDEMPGLKRISKYEKSGIIEMEE